VALGLLASHPELQPEPDSPGVSAHIHPRECPLYWSIRHGKGIYYSFLTIH
jgi:superfamily I DNA/RNA helicase